MSDRRLKPVAAGLAIFILLLVGGREEASCQEGPLAFHIRGGGTHPMARFRDEARGWEERATAGLSFGMGFSFPFFSVFDGYLGFSQHHFGCDPDLCPRGKDWVSTGFDVGLRLVAGRDRVRPWFQGGFHSHRLEAKLRGPQGVETLRSGGGGGYEFGGGILIQVGERTSLAPGVRMGRGHVPFEDRSNLKLQYVVVDLGLVLGF